MFQMKKVLSVTIALFFAFSMLSSMQVVAASSDFVVVNGVLTRYMGTSATINIPGDKGITTIGEGVFMFNNIITTVVIPAGVTTIEKDVFWSCESLKSVTIPEGVKTMGDEVFWGCESLSNIALPTSLETLGASCFEFSNISKTLYINGGKTLVYVPENVSSFTIPATVERINGGAFTMVDKLSSITIPDSVKSIGDRAFADCYNLKTITMPDTITDVGTMAFNNTRLTTPIILNGGKILCYVPSSVSKYTVPATVTTIAGGAFAYSESLTSVTIPEGVLTIGEEAFNGCYELTKITIPSSVTSIGGFAFSETGITTPIVNNNALCFLPETTSTYTVPNNVIEIKPGAAYGCQDLTKITLPDGLTKIGEYAFDLTGLTTLTIPESVTEIGSVAFANCYRLTSMYIPKSVVKIGRDAFARSEILTIFGTSDSYIRQYAAMYKINFASGPIMVVRTSAKMVGNNSYQRASVIVKPYQCTIKSITKDGKKMTIPSNKTLTTDAKYVVTSSIGTSKSFVIDKTKPKLTVKTSSGKVVKLGSTVKGTISFKISEKYLSSKTIYFNNYKIKWPSTGKLKAKGSYFLSAMDKAGNDVYFDFKIG